MPNYQVIELMIETNYYKVKDVDNKQQAIDKITNSDLITKLEHSSNIFPKDYKKKYVARRIMRK